MKPTSKSEENKIDLATVNKSKKQLKLPEIKNPLTKQKGPKRDDEGKFTAGSGGLRRLNSFNLKRALPLFVIISLVGGSMVYQSFAAACSITADKTSLYKGESTTIRWKSPSVPVVIDGGNMGSVKDGQWGSGALYATKTFKLVGGWDSSCTDSVTVTVSKKPATNPANPTTPAPTNPVTTPSPTTPAPGGGSALTDADAKFKWTDAQVKIARQNRDKAKSIAGQGSVSRAQLDSIAPLEKWVRDAVAQSTPFIGQVQTAYNQAKTAKKSQDEQNKLLYYSGAINNNVQEMNRIITEISNSYNTARQKYESAQANTGGGGSGGRSGGSSGSSSVDPSKCSMSITSIRSNSGKNCIAKLQNALGLTADGIWGPATQARFATLVTGTSQMQIDCLNKPSSKRVYRIDGGRTEVTEVTFYLWVNGSCVPKTGKTMKSVAKPTYPPLPNRTCSEGYEWQGTCIRKVNSTTKKDQYGTRYWDKIQRCDYFLSIRRNCVYLYGAWKY